MKYFKHEQAIVESEKIGENTRVWAFSHILPGAQIGSDCNVCDHTFIENDVIVGNRVTIKCGVQLWDGLRIEDDVFVGPNASFVNDNFPRSKHYPERFLKTLVCEGASIGANATILGGITIGLNAMVGAGAVVTRNVPPNAIVMGNPARIVGYVPTSDVALLTKPVQAIERTDGSGKESRDGRKQSSVAGVMLHDLPIIEDMRGRLSFAEYGQYLPFIPKRYFIVYGVPSKEVRGEHAHKKLHELLICVNGSCSVLVDNSINREEILLDAPNVALHIPPMIWTVQYKYSPDAVLLALASDIYDADDYIRNYSEYLKLVKK